MAIGTTLVKASLTIEDNDMKMALKSSEKKE